jgi:hypothetical protein
MHRANGVKLLGDTVLTGDRQRCLVALTALPGISQKFARNVLMDIGHPKFMDHSLALDSRIQRFLERYSGLGHTYSATSSARWTETHLVQIAHRLGLTAWQMDRLIYGYSLS